MIFFTGYGWVVIVIAILCIIGVDEFLGGGGEAINDSKWGYMVALTISAILCVIWGKFLHSFKPVEKMEFGEKIIKQQHHSLFFIKVQYWSVIFFIAGVYSVINHK